MNIKKSLWYKEPWFWIATCIIFFPVLFSLAMLFISLRYSSDLVSDNYYQDGKNIFKEINKENKARDLNIIGRLYIKEGELYLILDGNIEDRELKLEFIHPFLKGMDKDVILTRSDNDLKLYRGKYEGDLFGIDHWYIHLNDVGNNWIVRGRWVVREGSLVLLEPILERYKI